MRRNHIIDEASKRNYPDLYDIVQRYLEGVLIIDLARELRMCPNRLSRIMRLSGVIFHGGKLHCTLNAKLLRMYRQGLSENALAKMLEITPAAVSQHLRVLRDVGLVSDEKRGYFVHYRVNHETLARWKEMADGVLSVEK